MLLAKVGEAGSEMMSSRETILREVTEAIRSVEPNAEIRLYGSQARGTATEESDWDFLVLLDGPVDIARIDRVRHRTYEVEWRHGTVISSHVVNREKWESPFSRSTPFYQRVSNEGLPVAG